LSQFFGQLPPGIRLAAFDRSPGKSDERFSVAGTDLAGQVLQFVVAGHGEQHGPHFFGRPAGERHGVHEFQDRVIKISPTAVVTLPLTVATLRRNGGCPLPEPFKLGN
jgi:hypothetical protein